jgi:hypothetical protein
VDELGKQHVEEVGKDDELSALHSHRWNMQRLSKSSCDFDSLPRSKRWYARGVVSGGTQIG